MSEKRENSSVVVVLSGFFFRSTNIQSFNPLTNSNPQYAGHIVIVGQPNVDVYRECYFMFKSLLPSGVFVWNIFFTINIRSFQ